MAGYAFAQQPATSATTHKPSSQVSPSHSSSPHRNSPAVPATHHPVSRTSSRPSATSNSKAGVTQSRTYVSQRKGSARHRRYAHSSRSQSAQQRLARLHLDPERVKQIQQALNREGYLPGDPTGEWDPATRAAMLRYQTMHGFPLTGLPEAKSLMKLGLGPHPLAPALDHGEVGVAAGTVVTPVQNVFSYSTTNPPDPTPAHNSSETATPEKK